MDTKRIFSASRKTKLFFGSDFKKKVLNDFNLLHIRLKNNNEKRKVDTEITGINNTVISALCTNK